MSEETKYTCDICGKTELANTEPAGRKTMPENWITCNFSYSSAIGIYARRGINKHVYLVSSLIWFLHV